eukprot:scaffold58790_cov65-Phaeocystis_antarctica.AAC.5
MDIYGHIASGSTFLGVVRGGALCVEGTRGASPCAPRDASPCALRPTRRPRGPACGPGRGPGLAPWHRPAASHGAGQNVRRGQAV